MNKIETWSDVGREVRNLIITGIGSLIGLAFLGLCIAVPILALKWALGFCY